MTSDQLKQTLVLIIEKSETNQHKKLKHDNCSDDDHRYV